MIKSEIFYEEVETNNDFAKMLQVELIKKDKEIERLNNIINELENYFKEKDNDGYEKLYVEDILYKLKELKESGNK